MLHGKSIVFKVVVMAGLLTASAAVSRASNIGYSISIDTSSLKALGSGFVEVQLNPGADDALLVTASIYNVSTDAVLGDTVNTGAVVGSLAGSPFPTFSNTNFFNDLFESITWGNTLDFDVCLCGEGVEGESITGTTFSVSLWGPDGFTPLLTNNQDAAILHIDINPPDGDVTATVFPDLDNVTWATATEFDAPCPEPSTVLSGGLCLALLAYRIRRPRA